MQEGPRAPLGRLRKEDVVAVWANFDQHVSDVLS